MKRFVTCYLSRLVLVAAVAALIGTAAWWHGHGERTMAKVAAWTEPAVDANRPPKRARLGEAKRAYLEGLRKGAKP